MADKIRQPKNAEIKAQKVAVNLVWRQTFLEDANNRFSSAQKFVDSECIRLMIPYTPMRNGIMMKSPVLGTKIGSGNIVYQSPYARYQYYGKMMVSRITGSPWARQGESKILTEKDLTYDIARHPKAQRMWFEAMKADKKEQILRGTARISGGKNG